MTREELILKIHNALGGNGWAYSDYGNNEIVNCKEQLERVADLFFEVCPKIAAQPQHQGDEATDRRETTSA